MTTKIYHLECQCENPLHTIKLEKDPEYNEWGITIILYKWNGFFSRLKACAKYLFGREVGYDYFILREEDKKIILEWLDQDCKGREA